MTKDCFHVIFPFREIALWLHSQHKKKNGLVEPGHEEPRAGYGENVGLPGAEIACNIDH